MSDHPAALAYSPGKAAEVIGCSRPFIYTLINEGEIRAFKIKARTFIARSELEAFIARNLERVAA
ncbi:helix-turn-helix domain-containing protein [Luteimonas sp. MJ250]|uniref:helix-turn-helix domain-containing protein n=1 Tax=Luteimonas sp. MJ250 TaxID=3129236 RepID=UPI0031BA26BB